MRRGMLNFYGIALHSYTLSRCLKLTLKLLLFNGLSLRFDSRCPFLEMRMPHRSNISRSLNLVTATSGMAASIIEVALV